jgi:hypothetical protein
MSSSGREYGTVFMDVEEWETKNACAERECRAVNTRSPDEFPYYYNRFNH